MNSKQNNSILFGNQNQLEYFIKLVFFPVLICVLYRFNMFDEIAKGWLANFNCTRSVSRERIRLFFSICTFLVEASKEEG